MEIRRATEADFPSIQLVIAQFPENLMQVHLPKPEEFFVAEEGGKVVGCCALEAYSQRLAEVRSLAVVKEFQGKGIATKLINACLNAAKAQNIYEVLAISGATEIFERHGFATFKNEKYALIKIIG